MICHGSRVNFVELKVFLKDLCMARDFLIPNENNKIVLLSLVLYLEINLLLKMLAHF